jgi:hypothetical protein
MSDDEYGNELSIPSHRAISPVPPRGAAFAGTLRRPNTGGGFSAKIVRWRAENQARALQALANRAYAEAEYFDAQVQLIDSYIAASCAADTLRDLPDILALDRARRKAQRAEAHQDIAHGRALAKHRRTAELARAEHDALNAKHALQNQRDLYEFESSVRAQSSFYERESASRGAPPTRDDPIGEEEHILMAAKILRRRRTAVTVSPTERMRYR